MLSSQAKRKPVTTKGASLTAICGAAILLAASSLSMPAQVSVTTWHNDIGRTGQNLNETILNTSDVNTTQFGKLFSQTVDGYVYAQPLYLPNVTIGGQSHNVVFVATEHDTVYAFDADNNGGSNGAALWTASMLSTAHGAAVGATTVSSGVVGSDIVPEVGITGTPVIDPSTGTLFVVSKTQEGSSFVQRLHALDVTSGAEKFGGPIRITATVPGTGNGSVNGQLTFDPEWENQRPGLLLLNGIVYIGYASHGDNGPWHGWVLGYDSHTLVQTGAFCNSHNGVGSGIWMSGAGLAADLLDPVNHPYGRMFLPTGNGDYTASKPYTANMDYGDSILNLDLSNGNPNPTDAFTPYNQAQLDATDSDQASGGLMVLPTQTGAAHPNVLAQTGKSGNLFLLDRENLGGYNTAGDQVLQELNNAVGNNGAWSTPAYWNGTVYYWGVGDKLKAFPLVNGLLTGPSANKSSETYGYPGATPSISANGNQEGIIWTIESDQYSNQGQAILQAHSAANPSITLYSSSTNANRDKPGAAVKFAVPTIANGKVYVGTETQISVFGLLNGQQVAAAPNVTPASETFNGTLVVTMTDTTPGATIYYTLDGTTPTTSSPVYSSPLTLTANTTIQAVASASGYLQSAITTQTYVNSSQVSAPVFNPGGTTYTQPVAVTITDSTTGAVIYYTTDGSTPTTASQQYTAPVVISATTTLKAYAVAPGFADSAVTSATYTLNIGQTGINFPTGFSGTSGIVILNGSAGLNDSRLQLTNGGFNQAGSAWFNQQVNVQAFTTEFTFQLSNPAGDGMTFAIQGQSLAALGGQGSSLGYQGMPNSIAVKFDLFSNSGEGPDSTGLYLNGASPTLPSIDLSNTGINLHSDDTMDVVLSYNGTILTMTITDKVTNASFTTSWTVNIPAIVGGNTAWVGFTGGTGGNSSSQKILTWNYTVGSNTPPVLTAPVFSPSGGQFTSAQTVSITNATAGASIYYTTDGSTPTASSTLYSNPITVSTAQTLSAIAVKTGYTTSPVATASFSFGTAAPTPTFSLPAGTYSSAQTVTISDTLAGATIYYTTNGTVPTTSSFVYSGPITVGATETIAAIAVKTGYINSATASAAYTITSGGTIYVNYPSSGFTATNLALNHGASVVNGLLQVLDGSAGENHSAWYATTLPVQSFITDFTFQLINPNGDGITFTVQNVGPLALGGTGGSLGYQGIANSVALKFDLFGNSTEGPNSTGVYTGGAAPTVPAVDLTSSGVNLHSGNVFRAHVVYDGTNLTLTLTDTVTNATTTQTFPVNIPSAVGGTSAYVGFTGGTGGSTVTANVLSWTYESPAGTIAATPTFTPAAGTYSTTQTVAISSTTAGATIYYTTDGSTPTTSSTVYSAPITVSATQTLKAIAAASGFTTSGVASAAYTIAPAAATPTFTPAAGSYSTAQTVTISDTTPGATIYYTTNGATPTPSASIYTGPITVSASQTVQAIATATGFSTSAVGSAAYTITSAAATPTFSPAGGTYATTQTVTISSTTPGATIYYTTNGLTPTPSASVYTGPITVSATQTVKAIATATNFSTSAVGSAAYTISSAAAAPAFSPAGGTYSSAQSVTLSDTTAGATIYYTTNGTTPTTSSTVYSGPISVSATQTINAIAAASGFSNSAVASATYTISPVASAPAFSVPAGTYSNGQSVAITDATPGATIYYTRNGTTPTTASAVYTAPISVTNSQTLQAIAVAPGFAQSNVSTAAYNLAIATPVASPGAGTYGGPQTITLSSTSTSAQIWYTTNGATPSANPAVATLYSGPITISANTTLKFIGSATGYSPSVVVVQAYVINGASPTPVISPAGGTYTTTQTVSITDSAAGAAIYYTTDGTTPTASSTLYSGSISVATSQTVKAIAIASGFAPSAVASTAYTIAPLAATPVFSPAGGAYTSAQSVTITDATAGATIYYTTDGSTPTTSSAVYSGPITVSASSTLSAIAAKAGNTNSAVATVSFTINAGSTVYVNYPANGFPAGTLSLVNGATIANGILKVTDGGVNENRAAWFSTAVPVGSFINDFSFQQLNANADGMTFTIQGQSLTAAGGGGGNLGYQGITKSAAIKFDLFSNSGEGPDSTGLYTGGASPMLPSIDLSSTGVNFHSGDTMQVHMVYDGTTLSWTITDTVTNATTTQSATVNIPNLVGGTTAYIGFTGGTGGSTATQNVLSWSYISPARPTAASPTFSVPAGTYPTAQTVTISSATPGAAIYYTTNGAAPTGASTLYTGPITVSTSQTVKAMAAASGYVTSPAASVTYVIGTPMPAPTFSLAAGTYATTQTVSISEATAGATIYYTTNGATPTTSSNVYSGPITVSISQTISAIAVQTGFVNSPVASASYVITSGGTVYVNYPSNGFVATGLTLNGGATVSGGVLHITDGGGGESRNAWTSTVVPISTFTTDFTFQQTSAAGDGMTFTIQAKGPTALGGNGGGLGYQNITKSVAVKFDLFSNSGEGPDSTGLYTGGASPTLPSVDLSSTGVDLHSGHIMSAHVVYDGTNLTMTLTDTITNASTTQTFAVNIPSAVGATSAYVGFTGGTGGSAAVQNVLSWTYVR